MVGLLEKRISAKNLNPELMKHYADLIIDGIFHDNGSRNNIILEGGHAIKYAHGRQPIIGESPLVKEYLIGLDLIANGVCVPEMYAIVTNKHIQQFVVMERLQLFPYGGIIGTDSFGAREKDRFVKQREIISDLGYSPIDIIPNCSWSGKHQDIVFYDFEQWEGQRVDEIMRIYKEDIKSVCC